MGSHSPFPPLILGTARLGSVAPDALLGARAREEPLRWLDEMFELGLTTLDTAASYQLGGTERAIGRWMAARGNRERLFLISKGGHPYPVVRPHRLSAKELGSDLHASLRRLGTDRIDLYLLHRDDPAAPVEPMLDALLEHQRRGEIGAYGVSSWTHARVRTLLELARARGAPPPAASSPHFSLVEWSRPPWKGCVSIAGRAQREARDFYAASQLPVLAWAPLGSGFFAEQSTAGSRVYASAENLARKRRATELGARLGLQPAQVALAYLFSQPFPVSAIVSTTAAKMKSNLDATKHRLCEEDLRWLALGEPTKIE